MGGELYLEFVNVEAESVARVAFGWNERASEETNETACVEKGLNPQGGVRREGGFEGGFEGGRGKGEVASKGRRGGVFEREDGEGRGASRGSGD